MFVDPREAKKVQARKQAVHEFVVAQRKAANRAAIAKVASAKKDK